MIYNQPYNCMARLIPQSLHLKAPETSRDNARSRVRVNQRVSAVRAVALPVIFCLRSSYNHVTEVGGP